MYIYIYTSLLACPLHIPVHMSNIHGNVERDSRFIGNFHVLSRARIKVPVAREAQISPVDDETGRTPYTLESHQERFGFILRKGREIWIFFFISLWGTKVQYRCIVLVVGKARAS